jgi:hypothetical protein
MKSETQPRERNAENASHPSGEIEAKAVNWRFKCPDGWEILKPWGEGYVVQQKDGGLHVIVDSSEKADGSVWLHVSASRKHWTPSHADMALVKSAFIGEDRYAYSVWPPRECYVNIHLHCLHLWARLDESDGRVLPEFSAELEGIGRSV